MSQSYIEINGKRYDPISGLPVNANNPIEPESVGLRGAVAEPVVKPRQAHQLASHLARHSAQKSRTLKRNSVKKPVTHQKPAIKTTSPAEAHLSTKTEASLIKKSTASVAPSRTARAHQATKSTTIRHFSQQLTGPSASKAREQIAHAKTGTTFDIAPPPRRQSLALAAAPASIASAPVKSQFTELLERHEETTHHRYLETPKAKRSLLARLRPGHKRAAGFAAVGLTILLVAGFIVWQNKANIELQLADAKAGIHATLPGQVPSGYGAAQFRYEPGLVAIKYESGQDGHYFQFIQKASGYATSSTLASLVGSNGGYQTVNAEGQTVYINTSGNQASAAWLNGGILHLVKGNASLSRQQLIELATSS